MGAEFWAVSSRTADGVSELFCRMAALAFDSSVCQEKEVSATKVTVGSDLVCKSSYLNHQGPDFDDMSSFFPCEIDDAILYIVLGYGA